MSLGKIKASKYTEFCHTQFAKKKAIIEARAVEYVLESTNSHTYFVQKIFTNYMHLNLKKLEQKKYIK